MYYSISMIAVIFVVPVASYLMNEYLGIDPWISSSAMREVIAIGLLGAVLDKLYKEKSRE